MLWSSHAKPTAKIKLLAYPHLFLSDSEVSRDLNGSISITLHTEISVLQVSVVVVHIRLRSHLYGSFFALSWCLFRNLLLEATGPGLEAVGKV